MLIQWNPCGDSLIHNVMLYFELVNLLLLVPFMAGTVKALIQRRPHINLLCVLVPAFLHVVFIYIPARVIILFSTLVETIENPEKNIWILSSSMVCLFSINYMCICMFVVFVERCLATKFVRDYEYRPRHYIGFLSLLVIPFCAAFSYAVFVEKVSWISLAVADFAAGAIGSTGITMLSWRNANKFKKVMESPVNSEYTLSLRYQLNENIRTTELVRDITLITGLCPVINMFFFVGMHIFTNSSAVMRAAFYFSISMETIFMLAVAACKSPSFRNAALRTKWSTAESETMTSKKTSVSGKISDSDRYFDVLYEQWNKEKKKPRV